MGDRTLIPRRPRRRDKPLREQPHSLSFVRTKAPPGLRSLPHVEPEVGPVSVSPLEGDLPASRSSAENPIPTRHPGDGSCCRHEVRAPGEGVSDPSGAMRCTTSSPRRSSAQPSSLGVPSPMIASARDRTVRPNAVTPSDPVRLAPPARGSVTAGCSRPRRALPRSDSGRPERRRPGSGLAHAGCQGCGGHQ